MMAWANSTASAGNPYNQREEGKETVDKIGFVRLIPFNCANDMRSQVFCSNSIGESGGDSSIIVVVFGAHLFVIILINPLFILHHPCQLLLLLLRNLPLRVHLQTLHVNVNKANILSRRAF